MNALLGAMNIPGIHHKSLKRRERSMGGVLEAAAKRSCHAALVKECEKTRAAGKF